MNNIEYNRSLERTYFEISEADKAFIKKACENHDTLMDALSQCHNLFEAEEKQLSQEGKRVWQVVITAILKANHKP